MSRRNNFRRRTSRAKHDKSGTFLAVVLVILTISVVIALGVIYVFASNANDKIDNKTHCLKGSPEAITVVLIDHTDHLNPTQKASLETRLWDVASSIPKNSLIEVYSVDRIIDHILVPEIRLCNPGDKESVSSLTANKDLTQRRYERGFKQPLNKLLDRLVSAETLEESPIMESLQSVAVSGFVGDENKLSKKRLILVSDLLQNNRSFSIYSGVPDFENYKKTAHWASVKSDLLGVDIEVYILRRNGQNKLQNSNLWNFWRNYLENQRATVTRRLAIEG